MSSSRDAGYAADQAIKIIESKCELAEDGKHDFEKKGSWPSEWGTCKKCGVSYFWK